MKKKHQNILIISIAILIIPTLIISVLVLPMIIKDMEEEARIITFFENMKLMESMVSQKESGAELEVLVSKDVNIHNCDSDTPIIRLGTISLSKEKFIEILYYYIDRFGSDVHSLNDAELKLYVDSGKWNELNNTADEIKSDIAYLHGEDSGELIELNWFSDLFKELEKHSIDF